MSQRFVLSNLPQSHPDLADLAVRPYQAGEKDGCSGYLFFLDADDTEALLDLVIGIVRADRSPECKVVIVFEDRATRERFYNAAELWWPIFRPFDTEFARDIGYAVQAILRHLEGLPETAAASTPVIADPALWKLPEKAQSLFGPDA